MTEIEKPMTIKEAAEYMQVGELTLRRYIREGAIKACKMGGLDRTKENRYRWRIYREDIDNYLKGNSNVA